MSRPSSSIFLLSLSLSLSLAFASPAFSLNCQTIDNKFGIKLDSFKFPISFDTIQESPPTQTQFSINLDLCKPLPQDSSIPSDETCSKGTRICLKKINKSKGQKDRLIQVIPVAGSDGKDTSLFKSGSDKSHLDYEGTTYNGIQQQTNLELICDQSISNDDSIPIFESYDELNGVLKLNWKHDRFCSKGKNDDGGNDKDENEDKKKGEEDDKKSSSGWGFFSWFFFLIFLIFSIYLITGIYQNHQAGSRGIELLPHRQFWSEVPSMIRDFVSQAGSGIRLGGSRSGGGRGEYEAL